MVLFRLYYLGLAPYDNARHFLGLSEQSWVSWSEEVRRRCGKELLSRRMFPPRKYFSKRRVGTIETKRGTAMPCPYRESTSPTRNSLPHSDDATRVFVARR